MHFWVLNSVLCSAGPSLSSAPLLPPFLQVRFHTRQGGNPVAALAARIGH